MSKDSDDTLDSLEHSGERYEGEALLGAGGMGEVRLCLDKLIGREIARKTILPHARNKGTLARFVREAKVQARLEHPSIVPVYDIGRAEDGAIWFTMKRVRGRSLAEVIAAGEAEASRRKLLGAFVAVCYAVAFAHERGVIHRDLKPSNIMLGSFGEVSVLDWGIAKVVGTNDPALSEEALTMLAPRIHATEHGAAIGTIGYMSPEQSRGDEDIGPASDVYALGAILFEILAGERLHLGDHAIAVMLDTVRGVDARPSARGKDVPIELDDICVAATRVVVKERTASARDLARAVERYLDGDRDLERRRELSAEHTEKALAATKGGGAALLELGRALALDPSNERARDLLAKQLVATPEEVPPEAREDLEKDRAEARRVASRAGALRYAAWLFYTPFLFWLGFKNAALGAVVMAFMVVTGAWAFWMGRRTQRRSASLMTLLAISSVTVATMSFLFGPFILVPGLAATNAIYFAMNVEARHRLWTITASVATIVVPFALMLEGVIPQSYEVGTNAASSSSFTVHAIGCNFPPGATLTMLLATSIAMAITPIVLVGRLRDRLTRAEERLFVQAWQLRATLPK
jgi:serine/threonine-protein kinase